MIENPEYRGNEKDTIREFLDNEIKPYLEMIRMTEEKLKAIDDKNIKEEMKQYEKRSLMNYIIDIKERISDIEKNYVEIIKHFKGLNSDQRDEITKTSEDIIMDLKKKMKEIEDEGKKDSYSYYCNASMLNDYESQLRMLVAIREGKL